MNFAGIFANGVWLRGRGRVFRPAAGFGERRCAGTRAGVSVRADPQPVGGRHKPEASMEARYSLVVNGERHTVVSEPGRSLLEVLREDLGLTGTKYGCGEGQCGACTVLVNGQRVHACTVTVEEAAGKTVTTIEGLALGDRLHPVQEAFLEEQAFQCGYCTPGMIMAAVALLQQRPHPTDAEILQWMNGNLCRCCGYPRILRAVRRAAERWQRAP